MLDHHKTAAEALGGSAPLPGTLDVHLDMERSGATISLDYFQPQVVSETSNTVSIDNLSLCLDLLSAAEQGHFHSKRTAPLVGL